MSHRLLRDLAASRFRENFGTEVCGRCDGLKAGPDVVATCYQTKQCYYSNQKAGDENPVQARLISLLRKEDT